ncbi:hypothetical protein vseg_015515 [Gypsophila vaccaria]
MKRYDTSKPHVSMPPGHVSFRILIPPYTACAIIGLNGVVQQKIIRDTGAFRLRVDDTLPGCGERVVHVVGTTKVDRTIAFDGGGVWKVSAAQAAVVRVYEVVEAVEYAAENAAVRRWRMLVVSGVEVWKRDGELKSIERVCGAFVRVLSPELLPLCADVSDELIEITGASLAVKKALVAVTHCLQGVWNKSSFSYASTSTGPSRTLPAQKDQCNVMESRENDHGRVWDVDAKEVIFRLICPAHASGGLVGWEKTVIKNLEKETGASILVSPPVVGCNELVITVSAMESKEWQYSPAQNAAACVFIKSMENGARSGHASGGTNEASVTAKLLIPLNQADGVDLTSNVENTEVQILDGHPTRMASAGEKIIQIVGELSDVHVCLFQVTWKLREKMFAAKLAMKNGPLLPHEILGRPPSAHQTVSITESMNRLVVSGGVDDKPNVRPLKLFPGDLLATTAENQVDCDVATFSSSELGSEDGYALIRKEVEIIIPGNVFGCIYGKDGCNMARVRQITGATVVIHDPSPGRDGMAIISGTPNQTQAAMGMLSAFINEK